MKILVIGPAESFAEAKQKFGTAHDLSPASTHEEAKKYLTANEVIFDFNISNDPMQVMIYRNASATVFLNTTFTTLKDIAGGLGNVNIFGFCGLPSFFNREYLEVSTLKVDHVKTLTAICSQLSTKFQVVEDRIGMVTPRVICMIINEAYSTMEDGTATREDIDKAMKLGTNYPFGPFEWCSLIGVREVVKLLRAVHRGTQNDRYKVSELLEQEMLG